MSHIQFLLMDQRTCATPVFIKCLNEHAESVEYGVPWPTNQEFYEQRHGTLLLTKALI